MRKYCLAHKKYLFRHFKDPQAIKFVSKINR